jgi:hypothetical protein
VSPVVDCITMDECTLHGISVFFFVEYLPEDDRKRPKNVGGLPHVVYHCT